jgi:hypothetical protein
MSCQDAECHKDRERKMVWATPRAWCDPCIADLVAALNNGELRTTASCCGHHFRPGRITLADGRQLFIAYDENQVNAIEAAFSVDINGDAHARTGQR